MKNKADSGSKQLRPASGRAEPKHVVEDKHAGLNKACEVTSVYAHEDLQCDLMYNKIVSMFKGTTEVPSQSLIEDVYSYGSCCIPVEDQADLSPYDAVLRLGKVVQYVANAQMHLIDSLSDFTPKSKMYEGSVRLTLPDVDDCSSTHITAHHTVLAGMTTLETVHGRIERIVANVFDSTDDEPLDDNLDGSTSYIERIRYESVNLKEKVLRLCKDMYKSGVVAQTVYESMKYGFDRFVDEYVSSTHGPDAKDAQDKISRYVSETCFAFSAYYACMYAYHIMRISVKSCNGNGGSTVAIPSVSSVLDVNSMNVTQAML